MKVYKVSYMRELFLCGILLVVGLFGLAQLNFIQQSNQNYRSPDEEWVSKRPKMSADSATKGLIKSMGGKEEDAQQVVDTYNSSIENEKTWFEKSRQERLAKANQDFGQMTIAFGFLFFLSIGLAWAHYREPFSLRLNPGFIEIKPRLFSKPISIPYSSLKQIRYDIQIIPGYPRL
ncbi:hypothetical protein ACVR0A_01035 [Streptococcus downei]|uniref:Uncharacterized protein n=1 Tax=Streptococcus downei MFe28 TaxID=764290 RepID=A0A380JDI6_STRDO|nr:hypothetical protein [Streptococcus downei]SUN35923.1 Uncharacterised protein [Streptococcus downei MFe28]